jgi:DNA-binding FadR family transcriptional regulator
MVDFEAASFSPILLRSLKDAFMERFESLILSGKFSPGERVPSERELGVLFGVSRPVVHEGLRTLESRGLVTIESRKGVRINDYRREGSIEMLLSILNYTGGKLSAPLFDGILEMRRLFEVETAKLASKRRTNGQLADLRAVLAREQPGLNVSAKEIATIDYDFHLSIAIASGNAIYPLLMNSFRKIYNNILENFFLDTSVIEPVFVFHRKLVEAIAASDESLAGNLMVELLGFSERNLRRLIQHA